MMDEPTEYRQLHHVPTQDIDNIWNPASTQRIRLLALFSPLWCVCPSISWYDTINNNNFLDFVPQIPMKHHNSLLALASNFLVWLEPLKETPTGMLSHIWITRDRTFVNPIYATSKLLAVFPPINSGGNYESKSGSHSSWSWFMNNEWNETLIFEENEHVGRIADMINSLTLWKPHNTRSTYIDPRARRRCRIGVQYVQCECVKIHRRCPQKIETAFRAGVER